MEISKELRMQKAKETEAKLRQLKQEQERARKEKEKEIKAKAGLLSGESGAIMGDIFAELKAKKTDNCEVFE